MTSTNIKFEFIGWCKDGTSDKVWVSIDLGNYKWATVWGRRGKKLQHKIVETTNWEMTKLVSSKKNKGYFKVDKDHLDRVYPEFLEDLEKTTMWALLST
jgi:hypothetical protein